MPLAQRLETFQNTHVGTYRRHGAKEMCIRDRERQDHVKKVTAPDKYPRVIEFVEEWPKTISGKIRRVEIRDKDKV